ncbi:uncharacterized protein LOC111823454 [Myotis lucifugus]|uniref:uncharacterized protein LOC111823454 n=1 Tax=Myotis lucifugus TaxID=59463 RepID=UPI000CCBD84D|nr:uncharacterized protein LOC111823454 [Myotis lucifugus]
MAPRGTRFATGTSGRVGRSERDGSVPAGWAGPRVRTSLCGGGADGLEGGGNVSRDVGSLEERLGLHQAAPPLAFGVVLPEVGPAHAPRPPTPIEAQPGAGTWRPSAGCGTERTRAAEQPSWRTTERCRGLARGTGSPGQWGLDAQTPVTALPQASRGFARGHRGRSGARDELALLLAWKLAGRCHLRLQQPVTPRAGSKALGRCLPPRPQVLAVAAPEGAAFMSNEAVDPVPGLPALQYTQDTTSCTWARCGSMPQP